MRWGTLTTTVLLLMCVTAPRARADDAPPWLPPSSVAPAVPVVPVVPVDPSAFDPAHPPVALSVALGVGVALVPLVIGSVMAGTRNLPDEQAGVYTVMGGLVLAPTLTHLFAHEWSRAAYFSAVPLACALAMVGQIESRPQVFAEDDKNDSRWTFAILVSVGVISSAAGVMDSMLAGERARRHHLAVAPLIGGGRGGLSVGGVF